MAEDDNPMNQPCQTVDGSTDLAERLDLVLPNDLASSRVARREATRLLGSRCSDGVLVDLLLVISELVNNAVLHTDAPCELSIELRPGTILVEVRDVDARLTRRPARGHRSLGRGLGIVQSLSRRWGIERTGNGKCVWAEIAVRDS
jgi:anti-sigma regulatory factor (Ser/Thr protein kinase)